MPRIATLHLVARLKRLRAKKDATDVGYMFALLAAKGRQEVWGDVHHAFVEVVQLYDLAPVSRYRGFCMAVLVLTRKQIEVVGVDAAILLARLYKREKWPAMQFKRIVRGVCGAAKAKKACPTYQWVTQYTAKHCKNAPRKPSVVQRLLAENALLRAEVVTLKAALAKCLRCRAAQRKKTCPKAV